MNTPEFQAALSRLLEIHHDHVMADVRAAAHQTSYDYRRAEQSEAKFDLAREDFEVEFGGAERSDHCAGCGQHVDDEGHDNDCPALRREAMAE